MLSAGASPLERVDATAAQDSASGDGSEAVFTADAEGSAVLEALVPSNGMCLLDLSAVNLVAAYRLDGKVHGVPGPDTKVAEHLVWKIARGRAVGPRPARDEEAKCGRFGCEDLH